MEELLEAIMVISFGISWPISIVKSLRSKTAKGKSLLFMVLIWIGYVAGTAWKILVFVKTGAISYPSYFYVLNLVMVSCDIALYFRNAKLDKERESALEKQSAA